MESSCFCLLNTFSARSGCETLSVARSKSTRRALYFILKRAVLTSTPIFTGITRRQDNRPSGFSRDMFNLSLRPPPTPPLPVTYLHPLSLHPCSLRVAGMLNRSAFCFPFSILICSYAAFKTRPERLHAGLSGCLRDAG